MRRGPVDGVDVLVAALEPLNRMSLNERETFIDYYVGGDTYEQIAARLGVSPQRAQQLGRQARLKVAGQLGVRRAA